jgi:hypothetical protein
VVKEPGNAPIPTGPNHPPRRAALWALSAGGVLLLVGAGLVGSALVKKPADEVVAADVAPASASLATVTQAGPAPSGTPTPSVTKEPKKKSATRYPKATAAPVEPEPKTTKPKAAKKAAPAKPVAGQNYRLRNVVTGKCLASMDPGASTQTDCASAGKVLLEPTRTVSGVKLYRLHDAVGGDLCLDLPGAGSVSAGTALTSLGCITPSSADNQEWQLKATGRVSRSRAVFTLVNYASGNCLDVANWAADRSDRASGLALTAFTCSDSVWGFDDHLWTFG